MKAWWGLFGGLLFFGGLSSCEHDDATVVYEEGTNAYVNQWMYEQMKRYYLWNGSLPTATDLSVFPKDYFEQLRHSEDPFSYTIHPSLPETLPKTLRGKFGFDIAFINHLGQVYGVVLYVLTGSPAQNHGLSRGDLITTFNGVAVSSSNYNTVYQELVQSETAIIDRVRYDPQSGFSNPVHKEIGSGYTFGQPLLKRIITLENKRVGYLMIPHFDSGMAGTFLQAFQEFKSQSVTEMIVDLRYNGGGDIASAAALSVLLAPQIEPGNLFIRYRGNANGGTVSQSFVEALAMNESQVDFATLRAAHPELQRIYVLCGNRTASASEIIINNLKPYMEVITIGEKTVGKDVAGFPVQDNRNPNKPGWILYPSIYKLFNANDQGNYSSGIQPVIEANELEALAVLPLGDTEELLLQKTLQHILGHGNKTTSLQTISLPLSHIDTEGIPLVPLAF